MLGEEGPAGGTARYVDSSVERLQVLVTGLTGDRFVITCNGRPLPLQPTGRNGEFVAGVRYRAWQPPSALHPTIPVHAPLTFDIVDTWMERSVAGCQYHVMHPGGRNSRSVPGEQLRGREPAARAIHASGPHARAASRAGRPRARAASFPYTLDLRTRAVTGLPLLAGLRRARRALRRAARPATARCASRGRNSPRSTDAAARSISSQAQKRVARQIHENGVTYNVYATADGSQRPWSARRAAADRARRRSGSGSGAACGSARGC